MEKMRLWNNSFSNNKKFFLKKKTMNAEQTYLVAGPFGQISFGSTAGGPTTYPGLPGTGYMNTVQRMAAGQAEESVVQNSSGMGQGMQDWLWKVIFIVGGAFAVVAMLNFIRGIL